MNINYHVKDRNFVSEAWIVKQFLNNDGFWLP